MKTIEQKAKAYDEALERAKNWLKDGSEPSTKKCLELLFPALRESENERIRKWLVNYFGSIKETVWIHMDITCEQILVWLEKQKEQKPATTEDMPYIADEHFYEREPADSFKYRLAEYMTKNCKKGEGPCGYSYNISSESILQMAKEELIKRGELKEPKSVMGNGISEQTKMNETVYKFTPEEWKKALDEQVPKEQKPAELSEEDKKILDDVSHILIGLNYKQIAKDYKQAVEKLIYARPSQKLSEEDKEMKLKILKYLSSNCSVEQFEEVEEWLNNLFN